MKNHSLLNFIIFTCFLLFGYSTSNRLYQADYSILPSNLRLITTKDQNSIETMNNGQRSFLLITAKSINTSSPRLKSIWLATYLYSDTTISLLPIFPNGNKSISTLEEQLNESFGLDRANGKLVLDQEFINVLVKNNYWWSGYFILDDIALTKVFNLLGDININGVKLSGEQILNELPEVLDNPQKAYSSQIAVLQSTCHFLTQISPHTDLAQIISLLPDHILTNLDLSRVKTELDSLYSSEHNPTCRFPTLEISRVER